MRELAFVVVEDATAVPLPLLRDEPDGAARGGHVGDRDHVAAAGVEVLLGDLPSRVAAEKALAELVVEVLDAAQDLGVELADAVELQVRRSGRGARQLFLR